MAERLRDPFHDSKLYQELQNLARANQDSIAHHVPILTGQSGCNTGLPNCLCIKHVGTPPSVALQPYSPKRYIATTTCHTASPIIASNFP